MATLVRVGELISSAGGKPAPGARGVLFGQRKQC
jgi:hypothetical protein